MIQNEVSILRRVKHPNIVLLIEEMDVPTELYLVMELVKVCILEKKKPVQDTTLFYIIELSPLFPPSGIQPLISVRWQNGEDY